MQMTLDKKQVLLTATRDTGIAYRTREPAKSLADEAASAERHVAHRGRDAEQNSLGKGPVYGGPRTVAANLLGRPQCGQWGENKHARGGTL